MTEVIQRHRGPRQSPLMDPKLRDRRIEVARDQGRRRLRRFLIVAVVVLLLAGAVFAVRSPLLDVDRVAVRGAQRSDVDAVRKAAGIPLGRAMVSVSTAGAEARVEGLPWVDRASVSRSWPGTVTVTVVERVPVAVVGSGSLRVVVDATGRAIGRAGSEDLPALVGPPIRVGDGLGTNRRQAIAVLADLPLDLRRQVDHIRGSRGGTVITLDDAIRVRWGDTSQQTAKSDALRVLLDKAGRSTIAAIDVSVPTAATVTRT